MTLRNSRQRQRAMRKKHKALSGFEKDMPGALITIVGTAKFSDDEDCPEGLALDVVNGEKPLRLFLKIDDCLLLEYVIQEARREHPVFFN